MENKKHRNKSVYGDARDSLARAGLMCMGIRREKKHRKYVCNVCRQIFRFSNHLLAHQRMCQVTSSESDK